MPYITSAVEVRNAMFSYGDTQILKGLDMTCSKGTIYVLLGASGCGKTTLLQCITGLKSLDAGHIKISGQIGKIQNPKLLGYMPQELALYEWLSIKETLYFFGKIFLMTNSEILEKTEFLIKFLDLPQSSQLINSLSGGQRRRTSLAVAMIGQNDNQNEPNILILDEPSIGLDPLVRERIWEYLRKIVTGKQTSVILSTHYLEEAKLADTVGLMRNGRLLTEKPPLELLEEYKTNLLQDAVLKLCKEDEANYVKLQEEYSENKISYTKDKRKETFPSIIPISDENVVGIKYKSRSPDDDTLFYPRDKNQTRRKSFSTFILSEIFGNFHKIHALTYKNFTLIFRSWLFVIALLLMPALQVTLFNLFIGREPTNLKIAVVNHEFESMNFLEICKSSNQSNSCLTQKISCSFLNQFPQSKVNWIAFSMEEEALESVKMGKTLGWISIPENFTEKMQDRVIEGNFATKDSLEGSQISVRLDMSDYITGSFMTANIYANYLDFVKTLMINCGENPKIMEIPLKFNAIYGSLNSAYIEYMQPSGIILILFFLSMYVSFPVIEDNRMGTMDRSMVAGVNFFQVMISYLISQGFIILLQLALSASVLILVFKCKIQGSIALYFLLSFLMGVCGVFLGFLFGTICDHLIGVVLSSLALVLLVTVSSGSMVPLVGISPYLLSFVKMFNIVALPGEAARSIVNRGWGFSNPHVAIGFVYICGWIIFCCILSAIIHRLRK